MIERISVILSKEWGEILRVDEEVDCYRYGLELLLSTFCNTIILVIIGIWICGYCLGKFNEYLYMLFFAEGAVIITIVLGYLKNKCRL